MCIFYLTEQHSKFLLHTLQVLYIRTVCDSTNINTIIEFVPNCLQHVNGDGFSGGSECYLQFRDTCTYTAIVRYVTKTGSVVLLNKKIHILLSEVYFEWQCVKTQTIIQNNPVYSMDSAKQ